MARKQSWIRSLFSRKKNQPANPSGALGNNFNTGVASPGGGPNVTPLNNVPRTPVFGQQTPYNVQTPIFDAGQSAAFPQILQMALQGLSKNNGDFGPIAAQATQNFQTKTIPSILERLNASGGLDSSAYMHTLGQAGADLQTNLAAQQASHQLDWNKALQSLLGIGLTPQYENTLSGGNQGGGRQFVNDTTQSFIKALASIIKPR